ncbi:MAG: hypothetical protein IT426_11680 [Pirellulales bacterium]|nr:hypothetical protein [Pirellulales bacterium]
MAFNAEVNLPRSHKAVFPDRCIVCGIEEPNSSTRFITGTLGWWTWLLWLIGKPFIVKAPACRRCSWYLFFARYLSLSITLGIIYAAFWLAVPLLPEGIPRSIKKWAVMGIVLLCLLPQIIYEVFFPKPFDITAYPDSVDYEFANKELVGDFVVLNRDAEWVKVNGEKIC